MKDERLTLRQIEHQLDCMDNYVNCGFTGELPSHPRHPMHGIPCVYQWAHFIARCPSHSIANSLANLLNRETESKSQIPAHIDTTKRASGDVRVFIGDIMIAECRPWIAEYIVRLLNKNLKEVA